MSISDEARLNRSVPFILAGCTAVSILSTDLVTPSIPDMPRDLGTDINTAQLVVSVNLIAYALAQLVHGPLADTFGRRRLLLTALGLFSAVSVMCAFAVSIDMLLMGRFAQGLLSSVPSVVIVLMIRELYKPEDALGVMTLYGAALGIAPALGPLMGGYLHVWFGWGAGFLFIAVLAMGTVYAVWRHVPESLNAPKPLNAARAISDYATLLANADYMRCTLAASLCFAAFFAYVTTAPVVFIDILGLKPQEYGLTNIMIVAAYILGNLAAARLRRVWGILQLFVGAITLATAAMLVLLGGVMAYGPSVALILIPMSFYAFSLAFVLAAGPLVALNRASDNPQGPAAALLGSLQLGMSAAAGSLSAWAFDGTAIPMVVIMTLAVAGGGAFILWQVTRESVVPAE